MLKSETREIGGRKLTVTQLGTGDGLRLFFKLGKLVGPSVGTLLRQWQGKSVTKEVVGMAITELLAAIEWSDFNEFVQTFAKVTRETVTVTNDRGDSEERTVSLDKTIGNIAFAGDYLTLMQWLGFCLEVNFASFFTGLGLTNRPNSAEAE